MPPSANRPKRRASSPRTRRAAATAAADLYGQVQCPACGTRIDRTPPGYPDPDAARRQVYCPNPNCPKPYFFPTSSATPATP